MVPRQAFINIIRELGYRYKKTQKRTYLYRKAGGTHCIFVPVKDKLDDIYVRSALHQAGVPENEIDSYLRDAKG
jgi:hypothetical protein